MTNPATLNELNPVGVEVDIEVTCDADGGITRTVAAHMLVSDVTELPYIVEKCEALAKGEPV